MVRLEEFVFRHLGVGGGGGDSCRVLIYFAAYDASVRACIYINKHRYTFEYSRFENALHPMDRGLASSDFIYNFCRHEGDDGRWYITHTQTNVRLIVCGGFAEM